MVQDLRDSLVLLVADLVRPWVVLLVVVLIIDLMLERSSEFLVKPDIVAKGLWATHCEVWRTKHPVGSYL